MTDSKKTFTEVLDAEQKKLKEKVWHCPVCDSTEVQVKAWVNLNDWTIDDSPQDAVDNELFPYCSHCGCLGSEYELQRRVSR